MMWIKLLDHELFLTDLSLFKMEMEDEKGGQTALKDGCVRICHPDRAVP